MDVSKKLDGTCPLCARIYEEADILPHETIMESVRMDWQIKETSKPIQVFVQLVDGNTKTIHTHTKHTLLELARNLESLTGIPVVHHNYLHTTKFLNIHQ